MNEIIFHACTIPVIINYLPEHDKNKSEKNERINYALFKIYSKYATWMVN